MRSRRQSQAKEVGTFDRFISMDWSGSGAEDQRVNLRIVEASRQDVDGVVVDPPNARVGTGAWTRAEGMVGRSPETEPTPLPGGHRFRL